MTPLELIIMVATPALSAGAAWGAVKATLNGTRQDVKAMKDDVKIIVENISTVKERVARLEGMLLP